MKILPNTQRLGKLTFDSNQVRKSSTNPNVLIAKASDGKDYGVVRKSDGSYDYAGSTRNLSLKDRLIMGINQESTPGDKLYSAASTLMAEPQRMITRGLTGNKYNTPGEVVANSKLPDGRLKNTLGLAADIVGDPTNLVGAGIGVKASKYLPKLFKSSKVTSKINNVTQPFKSEINWSKWNKEIPNNSELMKEYNAIEKTSKANKSWMKNPDGSAFKGTPEQFVQQNSNNFKKAFPNVIKDDLGNVQYNYHGTPNELKDNMFKEHFSEGKLYGHGFYTTPKKDYALSYAQKRNNNSPNQKVYELYQNANKKQKLTSVMEKSDERFKNFLKENPKGSKDFDKKFKVFMKEEDDLFEKYYDPNDFKLKQGFDYFKPNDLEQVVPYSNYPKSTIGNNGMFDMTNPNIYKALIPAAIGTTASTINKKDKNNKFKYGGKLLPLLNKF